MIIIGVDPGLTGALAFIDTVSGSVSIDDIPTKERATGGEVQREVDAYTLSHLLRERVPADRSSMAVCENVRSFGRSSVQRPATTDSLQRTVGALGAVFDVLRMPRLMVEPRAWQKLYGLKGKCKEARGRGELPAAVRLAQDLYPGAASMLQRVKDHNRAEAVLIGHYGRSTMA